MSGNSVKPQSSVINPAAQKNVTGVVCWLTGAASRLAVTHLVIGAATLVAFLTSGTYMLFHSPSMHALDHGSHVMFTSRHIYILAAALIHLLLGSYLRPAATPGTMVVQLTGSLLLLLAATLLVLAFIHEPVAGQYASAYSRFGLYSLFLGSILHVGTGLRVQKTEAGNS